MTAGGSLPKGTEGRRARWLEGDPPKVKREDIPKKLLELVDSMTDAEVLRFLAKIRVDGEHWMWTGWVNEKGYGRFDLYRMNDDKVVKFKPYAHRLCFVIYYGIDIANLELDHKCRIVDCVRPDHLEAMTWPEHDMVPRFTLVEADMVPEVPI